MEDQDRDNQATADHNSWPHFFLWREEIGAAEFLQAGKVRAADNRGIPPLTWIPVIACQRHIRNMPASGLSPNLPLAAFAIKQPLVTRLALLDKVLHQWQLAPACRAEIVTKQTVLARVPQPQLLCR